MHPPIYRPTYLPVACFFFFLQVHRFLGLSVGLIQSTMPEAQRKEAYSADVTYATNQELGFDYLRDHLTVTKDGTE